MKKLILLTLFLTPFILEAQCPNAENGIVNFIRNGNFDEHTNPPYAHGQAHFALFWDQLANSASTADYVHKAVDDDYCQDSPSYLECILWDLKNNGNSGYTGGNFTNNQKPKSGDGYTIIRAIVTDDNCPNYNGAEYLVQELEAPLIEGREYTARIFVSSMERAVYGCTNLSILLTEEMPTVPSLECPLSGYSPQVVETTVISDSEDWVEISGSFIAEGNEKFLTIGVIDAMESMLEDLNRGHQPNDLPWDVAAYAVDQVSLELDLCDQDDYNNTEPIVINDGDDIANALIVNVLPWVVEIDNATGYRLEIFNRWGNKIHEIEEYDGCGFDDKLAVWNGFQTLNIFGNPIDPVVVVEEVYVYVLTLWNCDEENDLVLGGDITVLIDPSVDTSVDLTIGLDVLQYDCSCGDYSFAECEDLIINEQITETKYYGGLTITSFDTTIDLDNDECVTFVAEDRITLEPSFTVVAGSKFLAYLLDCDEQPGMLNGGDPPNNLSPNNNTTAFNKTKLTTDKSLSNYKFYSDLRKKDAMLATESKTEVFELYPNPSSQNITISLPVSYQDFRKIEIYNAMGKLVDPTIVPKQTQSNSVTIDISTLSPGVYFCKVIKSDQYEILNFVKVGF